MARRRSIFTTRNFRTDTSGFNTSNSPSPSGTSRSVRYLETRFNRRSKDQECRSIPSHQASLTPTALEVAIPERLHRASPHQQEQPVRERGVVLGLDDVIRIPGAPYGVRMHDGRGI